MTFLFPLNCLFLLEYVQLWVLTENLVIFKSGLRDKKSKYYGSSLTNLIFRVVFDKKIILCGELLKKGAWTVCRSKRGFVKTEEWGGIFDGG